MPPFLANPDMLATFSGASAVAVMLLVWKALLDPADFEDRLKAVSERREELEDAKRARVGNKQRQQIISMGLMKRVVSALKMGSQDQLKSLKLKLVQAGHRGRDAITVFLFMKLVTLSVFAGLPFLFVAVLGIIKMKSGMMLIAISVGAALGWMFPDIVIKNQKQKREGIMRKGVPDALDLMVICAEAGLSLDASFDRVSREMAQANPLVAEEFGLTGVELGLLPERANALHNMAERVDLPGIVALANTLLQTEKFGTPLAQALRVLSAELREERMMKAEEKAARLPATLTVPMMIFILPTLFIVLVGPAGIKVSETMNKAKQGDASGGKPVVSAPVKSKSK